MKKETKNIYSICNKCSEQLYPSKVLHSDKLRGITISEGECDICGRKDWLVPVKDYFFAITGEIFYWD